MAANELTWKVTVDPALAARAMRELAQEAKRSTATITAEVRKEAQAAVSLQRQRSGALVSQWKSDNAAAISLQRQRSAALVAAWKAEQREQVRIAREAQRQVEQAAQESLRRRQAFMSGLAGGVTALIGVSAISEIRGAASAWLDYSSKLETTKIAFTTMLGSAQLAEQHLKELQNFALKTPFQFGELIDASQRMQALGFSAEQIVPILTDVGNAVAAAGGGSERLDRVVLALSQIQSKGKLMTQEMNQLAESGIPAWKMLEQQLGKSRGELVKMVEQGQISSAVFLEAFQKFSQQNFGGLMEEQSKTFSGAMSNIKDALLQTSATAFAPLYERLSENARALAELSTKSKEFQENLTTAGNQVIVVWDGVVEAFYIVRDVIRLVGAVATQIIGALTHTFLALASAVAGTLHYLEALGRFMAGDFQGAFRSAALGQQALRSATDELTQAARSQFAVAEQLGRIWTEAGDRAAAAANKMRNAALTAAAVTGAFGPPTVDPSTVDPRTGLGTGIFRKAAGGDTRDKTTRGGGGGSAAAKISEGQRLLNQLTEEYNRLQEKTLGLTKSEIVGNELKKDSYRKITPELDALIRAKAKEIETVQQEIAANKALQDSWHQTAVEVNRQLAARTSLEAEITSELQQQRDALNALLFGQKTHLQSVEEYIIKAAAEAEAVGGVTDKMRELFAMLIKIALKLDEIAAAEAWKKMGEKIKDFKFPKLEGEEEEEGGWGDTFDEIEGRMEDFHEASQKYVVSAFHGMADAATSAIEAWILYGGSLGKALKQALAAELAAVAARAAVQAMLHAAYAIGSLAFGNFAAAAQHGIAAAKFAAVAALTGVAARGLAVSAAGSQSGSSTAGGAFQSATRAGSGSTASKPTTTDVNRRANAEPQTLTRTLEFRVKGDVLVDKFVEDYNLNGRTRIIIRSDGQG